MLLLSLHSFFFKADKEYEHGTTNSNIEFPNNTDTFGKLLFIFQLENHRIKRMHCYVDPDFASQDIDRLKVLTNQYEQDKPK